MFRPTLRALARKKKRVTNVRLESTANTGFRYYTTRNTQNVQRRLEFVKYDPIVRRHVVFRERRKKKKAAANKNRNMIVL
mmetsp:Transcript_2811/g.4050  ORF Transcript_2811/g.4050 Transcript_2811/m.4050 type:complete len:80 (+) Transcript_2811:143-382(+)